MSVVQTQQYFVAINPVLVRYFQSLTVAAIFERAEYWFSKKEKQFYKFIEPCKHPCYREGDSWCEELGITRKVFRKAFEMIGIRYISKTQFDQEEDPFRGKFFAYYFDRKSNKTIFIRNSKAVEHFFQEAKVKTTSARFVNEQQSQKSKSELRAEKFISDSSLSEEATDIIDFKKGRSCTGPLGQSYVRANKDISNNTSNSSSEENNAQEIFEDSDISEQMIQVWREETDDQLKIPERTAETLNHALRTFFNNSLDEWKQYCRKVASSKFLMGEGSNKDFRIRLSWIIQERTIERVRGDEFGCDRIPPKVQEQKVHIVKLLKEKGILLRKSDSLKMDFEKQLRNKTQEILQTSSDEERTYLEREFEEMLDETEPAYALEFRRRGWKTMLSEVRFLCFVKDKIFGKIEENPVYVTAMLEIAQRLEVIEAQLRGVGV